jgi:hypothetical protein
MERIFRKWPLLVESVFEKSPRSSSTSVQEVSILFHTRMLENVQFLGKPYERNFLALLWSSLESIWISCSYGMWQFFFVISGVGFWVLRPLTGLLYQPRMIGDGDCGEIGGIKIGRGNRSTRRKPAPAPLCPPQIPHDQSRAAEVGSQRLTAWAMARPLASCCLSLI